MFQPFTHLVLEFCLHVGSEVPKIYYLGNSLPGKIYWAWYLGPQSLPIAGYVEQRSGMDYPHVSLSLLIQFCNLNNRLIKLSVM